MDIKAHAEARASSEESRDLDLDLDGDSLYQDFFFPEYSDNLLGFTIGFVVPQQSLRRSIQKVFAKTPGLSRGMVLSPFDVGKAVDEARAAAGKPPFDLLVIDETHRLNHRANQPSASLNSAFESINRALYGSDDDEITQLDWIRTQSTHQVFLLDAAQAVRPADLPKDVVHGLLDDTPQRYRLASQLRVHADAGFVPYIRSVLNAEDVEPRSFPGYDLRLYDDLQTMRDEILRLDAQTGLARMVAGYAWKWRSKKDPAAYDIVLDGLSPALELDREGLDQLTARDLRGRFHPHRPGLRPQLRRSDHRPGSALRPGRPEVRVRPGELLRRQG